MKKVTETYTDCCDFFLIAKNDEIRQKSDKFFKFFTDFFADVQKTLPKQEVKKAAGKKMVKDVQSAMMEELALKLAKK